MPASKRKPQSKLTFTPLPSSSPATKQYNQQIRDRAAAVGYDGSPSPAKRRRRGLERDGVNDDLPTPAATMERRQDASSDIDDEGGDQDDQSIRPPQRRETGSTNGLARRKRARQQQLDFSNARDSDSFDAPVTLSSTARAPASSKSMFSSQSRRVKRSVRDSSDESDQELEPVEGVVSPIKAGKQRSTRISQRLVILESEDEEEDDDIVVSSARRRKPAALDEDDEAESEGLAEGVVDSGDDDEDMPTTAGKQKRTRRRCSNSFIVSSPPAMIDSDDDLEIIEQPKRKRTKRACGSDDDEDEEEQPKRKGLRRLTQQDQEDLDEDLEFLGPSSDVEALNVTPRNTQSKQKAARNAALERLKRKRSGQPQQIEPIEEGDEEADEDDLSGIVDDDSVEEIVAPSHQERRNTRREIFQANEDDEDFIEDEDENADAPLGVPDGIPIEFTKYARMKAKELFKFAVEWMVQKKINPAFSMTDEIYDLSFRKLDDEVKGLAGSKFTSAAWTPKFTMSLKGRPDIAYCQLDRSGGRFDALDKCDACNRTGHPATYEVQFKGKPYHPTSLEEVGANDEDDEEDGESSSDSEDADTQPSYDHQGREVPPAATIYNVGKFCMANAETAHALSHWRYHLNEWVVDWLQKQGYLTDQKIVKRDRMSTKKRRKEANKIADRMEYEGVTKQLWKDFRFNIDRARESKQGRFEAGSP